MIKQILRKLSLLGFGRIYMDHINTLVTDIMTLPEGTSIQAP